MCDRGSCFLAVPPTARGEGEVDVEGKGGGGGREEGVLIRGSWRGGGGVCKVAEACYDAEAAVVGEGGGERGGGGVGHAGWEDGVLDGEEGWGGEEDIVGRVEGGMEWNE